MVCAAEGAREDVVDGQIVCGVTLEALVSIALMDVGAVASANGVVGRSTNGATGDAGPLVSLEGFSALAMPDTTLPNSCLVLALATLSRPPWVRVDVRLNPCVPAATAGIHTGSRHHSRLSIGTRSRWRGAAAGRGTAEREETNITTAPQEGVRRQTYHTFATLLQRFVTSVVRSPPFPPLSPRKTWGGSVRMSVGYQAVRVRLS